MGKKVKSYNECIADEMYFRQLENEEVVREKNSLNKLVNLLSLY